MQVRTSAVMVLVTGLVTGLVAVAGQANAVSDRTATAGALKAPASAVAGTRITITGKVPPAHSRRVTLQVQRGSRWTAVASRTSKASGAFSIAATSPATSGRYRYRVLAPATTIGRTRYAAVVTPTRTVKVTPRVTAVAMGWRHACALDAEGGLWCWGDNTYGELGDGTPESVAEKVSKPVRVIGAGWTAVTAGGAHTCGIKADHTAWCWGDNSALGANTADVSTPLQLPGLWTQISTAERHTCGVRVDGTGWCWGDNDSGQLGNGTTDRAPSPVQVAGTWSLIETGGSSSSNGAGSAHSCGIDVTGVAWCWGANDAGQLGTGSAGGTATEPVAVVDGHAFSSMSLGDAFSCGVTADHTGWCWGSNAFHQLGDGTATPRYAPSQVPGAWSSLGAGLQHGCGVRTSGAALCWGWNDSGQLGDGSQTTVYYPVPDPTVLPGTWDQLDAGWFSTVGVRDGSAWAWGTDDHGELGDGGGAAADVPRRVRGIG